MPHTFLTEEQIKNLQESNAVIALIDADIPAYSVAFMCEDTLSWHLVEKEVDNFMSARCREVGATHFISLLTNGALNYRNTVATTVPYKGNRAGKDKPKWFTKVREYLCKSWSGQVMMGIEADDALTIAQTYFEELGIECVLCSLDKDLDQNEGNHYNWKHKEHYHIDYEQGQRLLWRQVITGDMGTDNIPGLSQAASVPAPGFRSPIYESYMKVPTEPKILASGKPSTRKMAHAKFVGYEIIDDPKRIKPLSEFLYGKTKAKEMLPDDMPVEGMSAVVLEAYISAYWEEGEFLEYEDPSQRGIERFEEVFALIYMLRTVDEIPNDAVISFVPTEFQYRYLDEFNEDDSDALDDFDDF